MSDQTTFVAEDWFVIRDRGHVAVCIFDPPEGREEAHKRLNGQRVTIDGADYIVRGVEGFAITRPQRTLGLLVEPIVPSTAQSNKGE